ncbi:MAG: hypothetical protein SNF68_04770 [Rikenellaceae bacterium]
MINPKNIIAVLLLSFATSVSAQSVGYDVEFSSTFDNREYSDIETLKPRSGTDFVVGLTPKIYLDFENNSRLYFGADFTSPIGGESVDIAGIIYYGYDSEAWSVSMGLFERSRMMIDSYSTAFFSTDYLIDDSILGGVAGRYMSGPSFVEFVCDWESQPSATSREKFRLLSAARRYWSNLYIGYNLSMTHFAGIDGGAFTNVVDNALVNPCVGVLFSVGEVDVDARVGYLQSLQRDRSYGNVWETPAMTEIAAKIGFRGFSIDEALYLGDNLMPLYGGHILDDGVVMEYGEQLYTGDPMFATEGGFYNRAALKYERSFYDNMMSVSAQFVTHATSEGLGTEQILQLSLSLGGNLYRARNEK